MHIEIICNYPLFIFLTIFNSIFLFHLFLQKQKATIFNESLIRSTLSQFLLSIQLEIVCRCNYMKFRCLFDYCEKSLRHKQKEYKCWYNPLENQYIYIYMPYIYIYIYIRRNVKQHPSSNKLFQITLWTTQNKKNGLG